jgi:hypothetical protein
MNDNINIMYYLILIIIKLNINAKLIRGDNSCRCCLFHIEWVEVNGDCSVYWYWCTCLPSLLKKNLIIPKVSLPPCYADDQIWKESWSWSHHFESVTVATIIWLTVTEYLCHKWPQICSTCRQYYPDHSSFMTYHRLCS